MEHDLLTPELYSKIIEFQATVRPDSKNYPSVAIRSFNELFVANLSVYSRWAESKQIYSLYSPGVDEDTLMQSHELLLKDEIYKRLNEGISSNEWKGIFFSQDLDPDILESSELMSFLRSNNIYFFATMLINRRYNEYFVFFKTRNEGPFTDRDRQVMHFLQVHLSRCSEIYNELANRRYVLQIYSDINDKEEKCQIILNHDLKAISYSESVFKMIPRSAQCTKISAAVKYLCGLIEENTGQPIRDLTNKVSVVNDGYLISLDFDSLMTDHGTVETFYIITISYNYYRDMDINYEDVRRYALTERETQIAELIIKGLPNKLIADKLHISLSTVKVHIASIFKKLSVNNRMGVLDKLTKRS